MRPPLDKSVPVAVEVASVASASSVTLPVRFGRLHITAKRIPVWNFSFVLSVLCRPDCKDRLLSPSVLTAKTVLLLALVSGERRHALVPLCHPPNCADESVKIHLKHKFLPKSYFLRHNLTCIRPLVIPACPNPSLTGMSSPHALVLL